MELFKNFVDISFGAFVKIRIIYVVSVVAVICINVIGDTLRDVLDPKSEVEK